MIVLSEPQSDKDPLHTLLDLHARAAGQVSFAYQRIKDMTPDEYASPEGQMFLKMYTDERGAPRPHGSRSAHEPASRPSS